MNTRHLERYREIGKRIAYYREEKGWSQQRLADEAGISFSYLSKIEAPRSKKPFSLDVLLSIADALAIESYLLLLPVTTSIDDQ